jgi:hypothetical protein
MKYRVSTIRYPGIVKKILVPVEVNQSESLCQELGVEAEVVSASALIDTGSSNSSISHELINALKLHAVSKHSADTASGKHLLGAYLIDILVDNKIMFSNLMALEFTRNDQEFDIIIGMDILTLGDLAITNHNYQTVMSFRAPSDIKHIIFVSEDNKED